MNVRAFPPAGIRKMNVVNKGGGGSSKKPHQLIRITNKKTQGGRGVKKSQIFDHVV